MAVATKVTAEQIAGMNVAQLRGEIKNHFEAAAEIERKYPEGVITDAADETELKRLLGTIDQMEDRLLPLEQVDERKARIVRGVQEYNRLATSHRHPTDPLSDALAAHFKSPGEQFIESPEF